MEDQSKTKLFKFVGFTAAATTVFSISMLAFLLSPEKYQSTVNSISESVNKKWNSTKLLFRKKQNS
jgi:hypothetical protein